MILPIYLYGSEVLREESKPIEKDYPGLKTLVEDMFETMYNADGVGLAAPQIGKAIRLFVVDASPMSDDDPKAEGFKKAFINPEILERYGNPFTFKEGCLSIPNVREDVVRDSIIKIKYFDEDFNEHVETFDGVVARIIQHEYDHIEQILFTDHLSQLKKKLIKKKLSNIKEGKSNPSYKARLD